ncbi:hypothetical protein GCM10007167_22070 [Vulcaniibacterium thermophilum]|uniref:Uncharacterized protein n=1 Tax=Vulcaniibacterium thermophilum TaxID=1169913 RepID=A0A919DDW9_9GAMM|nr:hypothetical protein GCM10007167_22070 [Vulcaniibacterium thermophilum]
MGPFAPSGAGRVRSAKRWRWGNREMVAPGRGAGNRRARARGASIACALRAMRQRRVEAAAYTNGLDPVALRSRIFR